MPCPYKSIVDNDQENVCGRPGAPGLRTFCQEHFTELWWGNELKDYAVNIAGPAEDVRALAGGDWDFTVIAEVANTNFLTQSVPYTLNKLARAQLRKLPGLANHVRRTPSGPPPSGAGHTWIRLGTGDDVFSFGHTSNGVETPDGAEAQMSGNVNMHYLAVTYGISGRQKDAICDVVTQWLIGHLAGGREKYNIMGSNCTLFAKECCQAAGVEFPGSRIPTYSSGGLGLVYTPNKLYGNLEKSKYSYDPSLPDAVRAVPLGMDPVGLPV